MKDIIGNNWKIEEKIGEGKYADIYLASKNVDGVIAHCAVKYISLPKEGESVEDLIKDGTIKDESEVYSYYSDLVSDLKKDFMVMKNFEGNPYFLNCYEWFEQEKDFNMGIDIYIRMEKAKDLNEYFAEKRFTEDDIIKLGIDISSALEVCEKKNIIHKDIKPENIFYGEDDCYKLGDFGAAITSAFIGKGRKVTGTYSYMSIEAYNKEDVNFSTDIYSLGLVMYMLLNNGNLPFQSDEVSLTEAAKMRLKGEEIPVIDGVSSELMKIVLKACSYDSSNRYQSATTLKEDLGYISKKKVRKRNSGSTISVYNTDLLEKESTSLDELSGHKDYDFKPLKKMFLLIVILLVLLLFFIFLSRGLFVNCKDGYVKDGIKCVKGYYYCEEGYELKDDKCSKELDSIDSIISYSCNDGFNYVNGQCVKKDTKSASYTKTCNSGYTLNGDKCIKTTTVNATSKYSCSNGYTLSNNKCVKTTTKTANVKYSCSKDYTLSGSVCKKTYTDNNKVVKNVTCNSNCTLNASKTSCSCSEEPTYFYYCSKGTYSFGKCVYTETPTTTYSCSSGTYKNNTCYITSSVNATANYSCESGYALKGSSCVKTDTVNANVQYSCSSGYTLSGSSCTKTDKVNPTMGYSCSKGYTFVGKDCVLNLTENPIVTHVCDDGYSLDSNTNKCVKYKEVDASIQYE